jgi:hypothetical protein
MKKKNDSVSSGTINVGILVLPGAEVGRTPSATNSTPIRINKEIAYANSIWKQKINGKTQGVQFKIIKLILFDEKIKGLDINTENILMQQKILDKNAKLLLALAKKYCPKSDVFVFYMNGNHIGAIGQDGARVLAITYIDYPIIIMSNSSQTNDFILAHELGHFLFLNNRFGNTSDPNPIRGDSAHNSSPDNLMYPTGMYWPKPPRMPILTPEQIKKALEYKAFY